MDKTNPKPEGRKPNKPTFAELHVHEFQAASTANFKFLQAILVRGRVIRTSIFGFNSLLLCSLFVLGLGSGCGLAALRGGRSAVSPAGATLQQPDNPATASTQDTESITEIERGGILPPDEKITYSLITNSSGPLKVRSMHRTQTSIGAAQRDTARELSARISGARPVLIAGLLCLAAAGALAYFGWYTKAVIFAGGGVGIVVLASVLPGHEWTFILAGVGGLVIVSYMVLHGYYKGQIDAQAQATPAPTPPTP